MTSTHSKTANGARIRFRLHRQGADTVLAAADERALGKKYAGNGRVLDLVKFASFYGEQTIDADGLEAHLRTCSSANLVGEQAVGAALRLGLAAREQVLDIGGVAHLQLYRQMDE